MTLKTSSAKRLALYAEFLNQLTTAVCTIIRATIIRKLLDHIFQILPIPAQGYCLPLTPSYLKTLHLILSYAPHVEHLSSSKWTSVADFCLSGLLDAEVDGSRPGVSTLTGIVVAGLVHALSLLISSSDAHLPGKAQDVFDRSLRVLQRSSTINNASIDALACINLVLQLKTATSASFMRTAILQYIPVVKSLWRQRGTLHKDAILVSLVHCEPHLRHLTTFNEDDANSLVLVMEALFEDMLEEYCRSTNRERRLMSMDDLGFVAVDRPVRSLMPFQNDVFYLQTQSLGCERVWTTVHFIAFWSSCLDGVSSRERDGNPDDDVQIPPRKRQRMSSKLQDILSRLSYTSNEQMLPLLHILCFILQQRNLRGDEMGLVLTSLSRIANSSESVVSSWAYIAASL